MNQRPVSITYLVFGLIFLGVAALWVVGAATDADAPEIAAWGPAILIGAGVIGLIATVVNARRGQAGTDEVTGYGDAADHPTTEDVTPEHDTTDDDTDTAVIHTEENQ